VVLSLGVHSERVRVCYLMFPQFGVGGGPHSPRTECSYFNSYIWSAVHGDYTWHVIS